MPETGPDIEAAARAFEKKSLNQAIKGCVACLDGYLLQKQTPSSEESGNVKAYFSGHYQTYGINIQAACDHRCRFLDVTVAAPGGVNDISAFRKTNLHQMIDEFPAGKFIIGDNAYVCSEHLLTPFAGDDKKIPKKDAYNFYINQLRIKIEQAFGAMTAKWKILKHPLQMKLRNVGKLFLFITRLHNFCINEQDEDCDNFGTMNPDISSEKGFVPSDVTIISFDDNSILRDIIVEDLALRALSRPHYNVERNQK